MEPNIDGLGEFVQPEQYDFKDLWDFSNYDGHSGMVLGSDGYCLYLLDCNEQDGSIPKEIYKQLVGRTVEGSLQVRRYHEVEIFELVGKSSGKAYPLLEIWYVPTPGTLGVEYPGKGKYWIGTEGVNTLILTCIGGSNIGVDVVLSQLIGWIESMDSEKTLG